MGLRREFSKSFAQEERDEQAGKLRDTRKKYRRERNEWSAEEAESSSFEVQQKFERLKSGFAERLFKTQTYHEKQRIWADFMQQEEQKEIKCRQGDFDKRLKEILSEIPLSPDEQEKYLNEEAAKNMSLEDYLLLMERLSGKYLSHVTRYGIREQTFKPGTGGGHWAYENEFLDNFTKILESKGLQGFTSNIIDRTDYARKAVMDSVTEVLQRKPEASREEIIDYVTSQLINANAVSLEGDQASVHFARGDIASSRYGSEYGYDIYFYYPAEVIAKNYPHVGSLEHNVYRDNSDGYNDFMVWNKGKGIPLDAGLCCIPKDVHVDRETGSQYKLDEEKKLVSDPAIVEHINYFKAHNDQFEAAFSALRPLEPFPWKENRKELEIQFNQELERLSSELGFDSPGTLEEFYKRYRNFTPINLETYYREQQLYYQKPDTDRVITSEEFWEQYFLEHPDKKPGKVMYYSQGHHFKPIPKQTKEKDEVLQGLDNQTALRGIRDHSDYKSYKEEAAEEVRKVVAEAYDQVKK